MRKAILKRFVLVLLAALCINSVIFYIADSSMILTTSSRGAKCTIGAIDSVSDYDGDLMSQMHKLEVFTDQDSSRITLTRTDGTVITDSDADAGYSDNRLGREEMRMAVEKGEGYAGRYSSTLGKTMPYVACRSDHADVVLWLVIFYSGISEYLPILLPAAIVGFRAIILRSLITTQRLVSPVTRPMRDISRKMLQVKGDYTELHLNRYQHPEINVIARTIINVSQNVKEYLSQIDRERQIYQEFLNNASHELKTPIILIQGYAELLESGVIQDESMKTDFTRRIRKETTNVTGLISDILMTSRLKTRDTGMVMTDVRINVLLEEVMDSLKLRVVPSQVFMHMDCQPLCTRANVQQIKEPLTSLLSSAVEHNHPGERVWINIRGQDDSTVVRVRGNGMEVPERSLNRIFERFYRVGRGRSRKQGDTSLGLFTMKYTMNFYHETIHVTSRLEQGTESAVSPPLSRCEKQIVRKRIHFIALDSQEFKVVELMAELFCSMIENIPERE